MTLAPEQVAWADAHIGAATTLSGSVASWTPNDDGTVTFHVSFTATPPPTAKQAADDAAKAKAEREASEAALIATVAAQALAEKDRLKALVAEVLAEKDQAAEAGTISTP